MGKIILSYTKINNYHISPHSWLNAMLGIKTVTTEAMQHGKDAHKIIQDHCLGIKKDPRLSTFDWHFTEAEHHTLKPYNDKFTLHGYIDMIAYDSKVIAEIKTGGTTWSQQKFWDHMQWRYYAMVTGFHKALLITCHFDLSDFKTFYFEASDTELAKAKIWVDEAITGIEAGKFYGGLDENKHCIQYDCPYGEACHFKI